MIIHLDTNTATMDELAAAAECIDEAARPRCQRRRGRSPDLVQCRSRVHRREDASYCSEPCRLAEKERRRRERESDAATPWIGPDSSSGRTTP